MITKCFVYLFIVTGLSNHNRTVRPIINLLCAAAAGVGLHVGRTAQVSSVSFDSSIISKPALKPACLSATLHLWSS